MFCFFSLLPLSFWPLNVVVCLFLRRRDYIQNLLDEISVKNVDNMKMQLLLNHIQLQLTAVSDHNEIVEAKKDLLDFEIRKLKQDNLLLQVFMYRFSFFFSFFLFSLSFLFLIVS
jgi:hypothetical protein